ncbi:MAG: prepilin peptidase [Planctomycetota bacterium]
MVSAEVWENSNVLLPWAIVISASLVATVFDVTSRRVPNLLTGPLLLAGLIWSAACTGMEGLADAMGGSLLLALPYVILFVFAGGGAGDAKLMGALGAWLGLVNGVVVLVAVALSGVIWAVGFAVFNRRLTAVLINLKGFVTVIMFLFYRHVRLGESQRLLPSREEMLTMPYSVAVLTGVCVAAGRTLI